MKKYDVVLALAKTGNTSKLALARMLIDILDLNELYEPLYYEGILEDIEELSNEEYFNMLGINPKERMKRLEDKRLENIDADDLKNYDVALALAAAGNIEEARQVMVLINPKKQLDASDFKPIEELTEIIDEAVDKIIGAKEKLERKKMRENLKSVLWENIEK